MGKFILPVKQKMPDFFAQQNLTDIFNSLKDLGVRRNSKGGYQVPVASFNECRPIQKEFNLRDFFYFFETDESTPYFRVHRDVWSGAISTLIIGEGTAVTQFFREIKPPDIVWFHGSETILDVSSLVVSESHVINHSNLILFKGNEWHNVVKFKQLKERRVMFSWGSNDSWSTMTQRFSEEL